MLGIFNFMAARFGVNSFLWAAPLLALAVGAGTGAWGGYTLGRAPLLVQVADMRGAQAEVAKLQALASARALQQAQQRGNALTNQLAVRQNQISNLQKDRHAFLAQVLSGRACFGADAVRVLNGTTHPANGPVDLPSTTSSPAAAPATFATDADVGHWVVAARALFEQCRARLDSLIDWHTQGATGHED